MAAHLISLRDTLTPLMRYFNAHHDRIRFIAILSPT
jgi:hypothetical protein